MNDFIFIFTPNAYAKSLLFVKLVLKRPIYMHLLQNLFSVQERKFIILFTSNCMHISKFFL